MIYSCSSSVYDESSNSWEPYKALMHVDKCDIVRTIDIEDDGCHDVLRSRRLRILARSAELHQED